MKNVGGRHKNFLYIYTFIISLLSTSFVSANSGRIGENIFAGLSNFFLQFFYFLAPLFQTLLGPELGTGNPEAFSQAFLINLMIFIILLIAIYQTLCNMPYFADHGFFRWIVAIAATTLGTRWLVTDTQGWVQAAILPYNVLGVSLVSFLPLVLFFWFVQGLGTRVSRRIAWIFFAVVYGFMWVTRYNDPEITNTALLIYPITLGLCIIFFLFDGTFARWRHKIKIKNVTSAGRVKRSNYLNEEMSKLIEMKDPARNNYQSVFNASLTGEAAIRHDVNVYQDMIAQLRSG